MSVFVGVLWSRHVRMEPRGVGCRWMSWLSTCLHTMAGLLVVTKETVSFLATFPIICSRLWNPIQGLEPSHWLSGFLFIYLLWVKIWQSSAVCVCVSNDGIMNDRIEIILLFIYFFHWLEKGGKYFQLFEAARFIDVGMLFRKIYVATWQLLHKGATSCGSRRVFTLFMSSLTRCASSNWIGDSLISSPLFLLNLCLFVHVRRCSIKHRRSASFFSSHSLRVNQFTFLFCSSDPFLFPWQHSFYFVILSVSLPTSLSFLAAPLSCSPDLLSMCHFLIRRQYRNLHSSTPLISSLNWDVSPAWVRIMDLDKM